MTQQSGPEAYPDEVQAVIDQLLRIRGVLDVTCDICSLEEVRGEDLGNFAHAMLPHGTLRRTGGGRKNEGLLQIAITVARNEDGWRAIEFLAWFFRDQARGGDVNDFRPFALPPVAGQTVQLRNTLRFFAELFETDPSDGAPLKRMARLANQLKLVVDLYDPSLRQQGDSGLTK